uniref:Cytoplasmic dynein 2 heavy chain 1 n=1 Tax=Lygus hesperus TaxID=30085 RepID=A0A0A9YE72_LYGHE
MSVFADAFSDDADNNRNMNVAGHERKQKSLNRVKNGENDIDANEEQRECVNESVYAVGLHAIHDRLSKVNLIDDVMHMDCVTISTIPVKASITEQLGRVEEALHEALRQHTQTAIKQFDEYLYNASSVIERQPTTMDEIGKANKAFVSYREQLPAFERQLQ